MIPTVGYFATRGKAQMIRNLLVYKGVEFEDKRYPFGGPPDYISSAWRAERSSLGLKFPNMPYYIDDDVKLSQSIAILRYLARKHGMAGRTDEEVTQLDFLEQQALDFQDVGRNMFSPDAEVARKCEETLDDQLKPWAEFLQGRVWALGDRLTYVDFILCEALDWIREIKPAAFEDFPNLLQYLNAFDELPNIKKYKASEKYHKRPIFRRK